MAIRFGLSMAASDFTDVVEWAQLAEAAGLEVLGMTDSQSYHRDTYVALTLVAMNTSRIRIGPRATNSITRHPAVASAAIASVDELSGGRAVYAIATGSTALRAIGLKSDSVAHYREYCLAVKGLLREHHATYEGNACHLDWPRRPVPVYVTASGPRMLELAGEVGDGVVIGLGHTPEAVGEALDRIDRGAKRAGRRVEDLDVWWATPAAFAASPIEAMTQGVLPLAGRAVHTFRNSLKAQMLPAELHASMTRLIAEYVIDRTDPEIQQQNLELIQELGLDHYLVRRFALAGSVEDWADQLRTAAAAGARQFWLTYHRADTPEFIARLADEVMPAVETVT